MTTAPYVYRIASVLRVVDGDSFWAYLDVGFRDTKLVEVRINGIDCPETRKGSAFERRKAVEARTVTARWLAPETDPDLGAYWVRTEKDPDDFGRWLGHVWFELGQDSSVLADDLIARGLATRWPTRWHQQHDPERNLP